MRLHHFKFWALIVSKNDNSIERMPMLIFFCTREHNVYLQGVSVKVKSFEIPENTVKGWKETKTMHFLQEQNIYFYYYY